MIRSTALALSNRTLAAALVLVPVLAAAAPAPSPAPAPTPAPQVNAALVSFVPRPDAVFLEQTADHPDLGNARIILDLRPGEVERLKKETGRTDLLAVGPDGQQVVFRDDGQEGDATARDFEFTGIAELDLAELEERSVTDRTTIDRGETRTVPTFDQRTVTGTTTSEPFDFEGFAAGERVPLSRSLTISTASTTQESAGAPGEPSVITAAAVVPGTNQFQDRVLMIVNPAVIADPTRTFDPCTGAGTPMGPWTFGHLATAMANQPVTGINPSTFVETWLLHWASPQTINSFTAPTRADINALIADWRAASGGGDLDLSIAPFRLLAINPRVDLRTTVGGGGGYGGTASGAFLDAGEARFTFGVVLPSTYGASKAAFFNEQIIPPAANNCHATPFSVIFEYRVPRCKCEDVRAWARAWRRLNNFVPGSATYNGLLEGLTRQFTDANRNPTRPNKNAIGQLRTNEIAMTPGPPPFLWEIREFRLHMMPWSFLLENTAADTPHDSFNNTITFGNFVLETIAGTAGPSVPLFYPLGSAQNFLGVNPLSPNLNTFWNAPNLNVANPPEDQGRHLASLGTCNGCHNRETNTTFVHIDPNTPGLPALLSQFLTGTVPPVVDPAGSGTQREFDDLALREIDINAVANMICAHFRPVILAPVGPIIVGPIGPLGSDGTEVQSIAAAATSSATTDPDGPQLAVAPEDFLREPIQQVH
jgi:hypothetical protein